MKKYIYSVFFFALILLFNSCGEISFDETLLIGKWQSVESTSGTSGSGYEYYRFKADHTGSNWDTADDISESDSASLFNWTLKADELGVTYIMQINSGALPKTYTVTELTSSSLKFEDFANKQFSYKKVD